VFIVAGIAGLNFSSRLIRVTRMATPNGSFNKYAWVVPLLYIVVIIFAILPGLARVFGMTGLEMEAFILCLLILCAHLLAWEFSTSG
jgi:hypothetical protein